MIETWLNKMNSMRAYQLVQDPSSEKHDRSTNIQSGECLTAEQEILSKWIEICSELYNQ